MSAKIGSNEMNLTEGSIPKQLFLFAMPLLLGNMLQQVYFIADSIIVGRLIGSTALAAVGAASAITVLMVNFFAGMGNGAGIIIAQFIGSGDRHKLSETIKVAAVFTVIFGIMTSVLGVVLCGKFLTWTSTPQDVFAQAYKYLAFCFIGMLPMLIYNMGAAILQAMGDSRTPLYFLSIASVINIVLDLFFVKCMNMDVEGTAIATCIAQIAAAILVCAVLKKKIDMTLREADENIGQGIIRKEENETLVLFKRMMVLGLPIGIQSIVINFSNIVVQSHINSLGSDIMAAWSALCRVDGFIILPMLSFGLAIMTFTGQNFGAKKIDRIFQGMKTGMIMCCSFTICISAVVVILARPCFAIFTDSEIVIDYACNMVYNMVPFYFLMAATRIYVGVISGAGNSVTPMIINIMFMCVFRVIFLPGISVVIGRCLRGMYYTYWISWVMTLICVAFYYYLRMKKRIEDA